MTFKEFLKQLQILVICQKFKLRLLNFIELKLSIEINLNLFPSEAMAHIIEFEHLTQSDIIDFVEENKEQISFLILLVLSLFLLENYKIKLNFSNMFILQDKQNQNFFENFDFEKNKETNEVLKISTYPSWDEKKKDFHFQLSYL